MEAIYKWRNNQTKNIEMEGTYTRREHTLGGDIHTERTYTWRGHARRGHAYGGEVHMRVVMFVYKTGHLHKGLLWWKKAAGLNVGFYIVFIIIVIQQEIIRIQKRKTANALVHIFMQWVWLMTYKFEVLFTKFLRRMPILCVARKPTVGPLVTPIASIIIL